MSLIDNLRKFITIIDKLRDIGLEKHIQLPRIVVLGSQSSGKSSLLESIVGIDFLPRGDGLVTRRPLEMRLVNVSQEQAPKPYAIFEEIKDQKFKDFDVVRQQIIQLTDKIAGTNKNIVNVPIILTIYSSTCPDLTLVDLPGITRIPLHNSGQPENIEEITKNMALHYVKEPRTIILAVVPANADLTTSDALKMAKEIDPQGKRTLGVLTKIDIMDKGTSAKRVLLNQEIPLHFGYVGVKLRSQQDILDKIPIKKSLEEEKNFFATNNVYSTLPQGVLGIQNLTSKLTQILYSHIRNHLPNIVKEINVKIKECEGKLTEMGPSLPVTDHEKFQLVFEMIQDFSKAFQSSISGKFQGNNTRKEDIPEGSKFREQFNNVYNELLNYKSSNEYTDYDIKKAILLHEGDQLPGFQSMDAFYYLLQPQIQKLWDPAFDCLEYAHHCLESLAQRLLQKQCGRFPGLLADLEEKIQKLLSDQKEKTRVIIENILESEMGYLFTNDDKDFNKFLGNFIQKDHVNQDVDSKQQLILELRNKMDQYFRIVLRGVRDLVPKTIGNFYIRWFQDKMQMEITQYLNQNQEWKTLIQEPAHLIEERDSLRNSLQILNNAVKVIKKDPDLWSYSYSKQVEEDQEIVEKQKEAPKQEQRQQYDYNKNQDQPRVSQPVQDTRQYIQQQTQQQAQQQAQQKQQQQNQSNQQNMQRQKEQPKANIADNSLFGNTSVQIPVQPSQNKSQNQSKDLFDFDSFTDKAVDNTFANEKFQQAMKNQAKNLAYNAVDKHVPMQGQDGRNPLGSFAEKAAEKAVENKNVQDAMKNQVKEQVKDQYKQKPDKQKQAGFFGLFN